MDQTEPRESEARVTIRPKNLEAVKPYTDRLDRQYPHALNPLVLLQTVVGPHKIPVDTVPPEFWAQQADDDGFTVADVACPCGEQPRVDACGMEVCACGRCFFFTGEDVTVINSQKRSSADQSAAPDAAA
jgi:hypothetical protein